MSKIYYAGPLFNEAERSFNIKLAHELEKEGFEVFLPQRDGVEANKPQYAHLNKEERRKCMFVMDRDMILEADIFLFILDGRVPDEGACFELGIAYYQKCSISNEKRIFGLQTDKRAAFISAKINPMIACSLDCLFLSSSDLLLFLRKEKNNLSTYNYSNVQKKML